MIARFGDGSSSSEEISTMNILCFTSESLACMNYNMTYG